MTDKYRLERISRLLDELKYEITRGMMEREIEETLGYDFVVPISAQGKEWVVMCRFQTRPTMAYNVPCNNDKPGLRIVK